MIAMGKALQTQGEAILELKKGGVPVTNNHGNVHSVLPQALKNEGINNSGIESKISFDRDKQHLRLDVQFEGAENELFESRQKKCQQFLGEMQGLLEDYKVIRMTGDYVR